MIRAIAENGYNDLGRSKMIADDDRDLAEDGQETLDYLFGTGIYAGRYFLPLRS